MLSVHTFNPDASTVPQSNNLEKVAHSFSRQQTSPRLAVNSTLSPSARPSSDKTSRTQIYVRLPLARLPVFIHTRIILTGYFNGTPASTAVFALDVIVPIHFGKPANQSIDLVVSGPNEGNNNGPFLYTLSGTIGAAYLSVERGVSLLSCCGLAKKGFNAKRTFVVPCNCAFGREFDASFIHYKYGREGRSCERCRAGAALTCMHSNRMH